MINPSGKAKLLVSLAMASVLFGCKKEYFGPLTSLYTAPSGVYPASSPVSTVKFDIVIYGGTSSGVIAAIQAAKMGQKVALVNPDIRLGGMTTGGLALTDILPATLGGLTKDFFRKVADAYGETTPSYLLEPKVALDVFNQMMQPYASNITIYKDRLILKTGVVKDGTRISYIKLESGTNLQGKEYVDASYEGDLMATAGVSYTFGREDNSQYGEQYNGVVSPIEFPVGIDPYKVEGNPSSGLLPRVAPLSTSQLGKGDKKIMAYNYRICLTNDAKNRVTIEKPADLNMVDYEIMFRMMKKGHRVFIGWNATKNNKIDVNSAPYFSTDFVGMSESYIEGNYASREAIRKKTRAYDQGLIWLIQHDPRVPADYQKFYLKYGLAKDEFTENGNWPTEFYIREGRRMVSDYVMTDRNLFANVVVHDNIGLGGYPMDSHMVEYRVNSNGQIEGEGQIYKTISHPYGISFKSIVPKESECSNLAVSVCVSATHAAYGSIRMEPQLMILGQAAATAAVLAIKQNVSIQKLDYKTIKAQLLTDKQQLAY